MASVLMIAALMLIVGLALASLSLFNLNLSARWMVAQQSYQMAQAAVQQVLQDIGADPALVNTSITTAVPDFNFSAHYPPGINMLANDAASFPGTVTTDFTAGADHYSTDNLSGGVPVAGWHDGTSGSRSVPPYTVDLILKVTIGGQITYLESYLQRHWPYVLTTTGRADVVGSSSFLGCGGATSGSIINGKSLVFDSGYSLESTPTSCSSPPSCPSPAAPGVDVYVPYRIFNQLVVSPLPCSSYPTVAMDVGAPAEHLSTTPKPCCCSVPQGSFGNHVNGRVDLDDKKRSVFVYLSPQNTQTGGTSVLANASALLGSLQGALAEPSLPGGYSVLPATQSLLNVAPGNQWGFALNWQTRPMAQIPFYLFGNLNLSPTSAPAPATPSSYYVIDSSAGNSVLTYAGRPEMHSFPGGLSLTNCTLRVNGNLDLGSNATLVGSNASLVVTGTLLLDGGTLNSGGQGMVIWCNRLVCAASGTYQGLIVARQSALFVPPAPVAPSCGAGPPVAPARMTVQGALVAGQETENVHGVPLQTSGSCACIQVCSAETAGVSLHGLLILSTNLTYDPKYMANLNRYGQVQALSLDVIH